MKPLYDQYSPASLLYGLAYAVWLASEATIFIRTVARVGPRAHVANNQGEDRLSGPALIAGILLAVWIGSAVAGSAPGAAMMTARSFVFGLGFVLALAGVGFRWYAVITLGQFFTMRVQTTSDQQVVESGPYRLVRHPSYTGALMTVVGVLLCATNWLSLACFVLALPGFAYRMMVEEGALSSAIGEPYRDYMKRTKRLIPYVL